MDKSIILGMAYSSGYMERILMSKNEKYAGFSKDFEDIINKLCEGMTKEEKNKIILDLDNAQCGMELLTADENFKAGFKLGLLIGAQNFID